MEIFAVVRFLEPNESDSIYKLERHDGRLYWFFHGIAFYATMMGTEPHSLPTFTRELGYGVLNYYEDEFQEACKNMTQVFMSSFQGRDGQVLTCDGKGNFQWK